MCTQTKHCTYSLLGIFLILSLSCQNSDDMEPTSSIYSVGAFEEVDYKAWEQEPFIGVDDPLMLEKVAKMKEVQNIGQNFVSRLEESGSMEISDGSQVSLIELTKNACPEDKYSACNQTDSASLGTNSSVLLESFADMENSVKSQGDRGTCVAHAMASAIELLARREGRDAPLSEQHLYFEAKKATESWEQSGLVPSLTFSHLTNRRIPIGQESSWPYNPSHKYCQSYLDSYPDAACSPTEAQGVGMHQSLPDPQTASGERYTLEKSHQLFASVGRIKQALNFGYPVVLSVNINKDFELADMICVKRIDALNSLCKQGYASWVFKVSACEGVCGHAMLAFGYADDPDIEGGGVVFIKNSWGPNWSDQGIVTVSYEWLNHSLLDAQAVVSISSVSE